MKKGMFKGVVKLNIDGPKASPYEFWIIMLCYLAMFVNLSNWFWF